MGEGEGEGWREKGGETGRERGDLGDSMAGGGELK